MENLIEITGWEIYKNALNESRKADDRFEDACEYGGYPAKEGMAKDEAYKSLQEIASQYPAAAAWAHIQNFKIAYNDKKASAGNQAEQEVFAGMTAIDAAKNMEAAWIEDAKRLVANS